MSHPPYYYHYSGAQLARGIVAIREGRDVDPFLRQAIAAMPKVKSPLELKNEQLRRELADLRSEGGRFVEGFERASG